MRNFQLTNIFASKTVIVSMVEQNSQRTGTHILSGIGSNLEDCLDEHQVGADSIPHSLEVSHESAETICNSQVDFLSNFSSMMGGLSIGESKLTEHPMGVAVLAEMTLNRRRDALALHKMAQTEGDLERRAILYARMANTSLILHIYKATRETLLYIEEKEMCHPPLNEWEILSLGGLIGNPKRRKDWIQCKTDQDRQQEMLKVIRSCREYWNSKLPDDKRIKVEFKFEVGLTEPINSVEEMYLRRGEVAWTEQAEQADNESTS